LFIDREIKRITRNRGKITR